MMNFEWPFLLLILTSAVFLAYFLYRPLKVNISDDVSNVAIGRQKKQELADDVTKGLISESLYQEAEDEITRTLASELSQDSGDVVAINPLKWAIALGVIIAIVSVFTYAKLAPKNESSTVVELSASLTLEQSVQTLEVYLTDNTKDGKAWKMLGLAAFNLGDTDKALASFERAYELIPRDIDMLLQYASVLASIQEGDFSGAPQSLIDQALEVDPDSVHVLYLVGIVAANAGDLLLAEKSWQKALYLLPADHPDRVVIEGALNTLSNFESANGFTLTINLKISEDVLALRSSQDYLMVYAKALTGSAMPIAIKKIQLKDFNGVVSLSDADSLSVKLSESTGVVIVVRISSTGLAVKQADDIEIVSDAISLAETRSIDLEVE
ncbi:MAG: c-type cytochrome biogenesis protein CcmI [Gammaproteobacteria bacterium]